LFSKNRVFRILKRPDEKMASKSRNANFSQEEKLLLAELGKQYPDIENKGYDNVSLKRKQSSWEKVVQSFNAGNPDGNKRDMKAIQGCWKRMKLQTKKEFDEQRRESKKTGGGKAPGSPNAISKLDQVSSAVCRVPVQATTEKRQSEKKG
jgi:hypothetical protein